jgi:PAS domain S-box-containing protein
MLIVMEASGLQMPKLSLPRQLQILRRLKDASLKLEESRETISQQIERLAKQAEAERDALLNRCRQQITEPAARTDRHGALIYTAEWVLEMTGWTFPQIEGMNWYRCIAPEDQLRFSVAFGQAIHKRSAYEIEYSLLTTSNKRIGMHLVATPIFDQLGQYDGHQALNFPI